MPAAGHVDHVANGVVVSHNPRPEHSHPAPAYWSRAGNHAPDAADLEAAMRGWPGQLAQWAILFATLGLLIAGAKWWQGHDATETPSQAVTSAAQQPISRPF